MKNCFFTKLTEAVQNDNLLFFGAFSLNVNTDNNIEVKLSNSNNTPATIKLTTGTIEVTSGSTPLWKNIKGNGKVVLDNKEQLSAVGLNAYASCVFEDLKGCPELKTFVLTNRNTVNGFSKLSDLNVFTELVSFAINGSLINGERNIDGDIENVILPNLTTIDIENVIIPSGVKYFGKLHLTTITRLALPANTDLSNVEDMVAMRVAVAQDSTGSITWNSPGGSRCKFMDTRVTAAGNVTLSWEPSSNNTVVTFNGNSTTIHVNADGTWTRVS